jgi:virginiamycin B lyase
MKYRFSLALFLLFLLACLLTACGDAYTIPSDTGPIDNSNPQSQPITPAQAATGKFQEYALPQNNSGLMRPALDSQGHVWFGEMSRNYLGSFDPQSGKFWQETPPNGQSGIMGLIAAPDDTIWFAEQYANYIGHYFPQTGQYRIYQLPMVNQPDPANAQKTEILPSAPNDIALDKHGYLWFTELNANKIGSLNTIDGSIRQYPLPLTADKNTHVLNPYGITVDPQGIIWFTEASTHELGRLDPLSGQVSYFTPPGVASPLMEVASDAQGQIWATTFTSGSLLHFDPISSSFTIYNAPSLDGNNAGGLYGLAIAASGDVWVAITSESRLARFAVKGQSFFYYTIPTPGSLPIGVVEGKHQEIWFTESNTNKIGVLQP